MEYGNAQQEHRRKDPGQGQQPWRPLWKIREKKGDENNEKDAGLDSFIEPSLVHDQHREQNANAMREKEGERTCSPLKTSEEDAIMRKGHEPEYQSGMGGNGAKIFFFHDV